MTKHPAGSLDPHPERVTAALLASELGKQLDARPVAEDGNCWEVLKTADGGTTIRFTPAEATATTTVEGANYRFEATVFPDRVALSFVGEYSPDAIIAFYYLDYLHELNLLPGDSMELSGAQRVWVREMADTIAADGFPPDDRPA